MRVLSGWGGLAGGVDYLGSEWQPGQTVCHQPKPPVRVEHVAADAADAHQGLDSEAEDPCQVIGHLRAIRSGSETLLFCYGSDLAIKFF